ncbi:MAG TPA: (2Fe-2S) ferredoxin domain-containing protein [Clostridiales bacterium]|nr:(2Fe-2S) ferredoxin domain-containing protein [Clostridiales bacterium]
MLTISICVGSACHLKGAYNVINGIQKLIESNNLGDQVTVKAAFCLGECTKAVSVKINDDAVVSVNENNLDDFFHRYVQAKLK